ncbi:membrane protein [soil metagenome]
MEATTRKVRAGSRETPLARTFAAQPWREAGAILVVTRLGFLLVAYAASWLLASGEGRLEQGGLGIWAQWDALHFFGVAEHGYSGPGSEPFATAFWPGFPLALRALTFVGLAPVTAGLVISGVASLVAFVFLHKLADDELGGGSGWRAVTYLALFPTSVFLVAPYSEALFLAGTIPAFYLARRGRWLLAGVPAAVAVGTRAAGLFLLFGLALELLRQRPLSRARARDATLGLALGALPAFAYAAFLAATKGDALYFFTDQRLGWGRTLTNPISSLMSTWNTWSGADYPSNWIFAWRLEIVAAAVGIGLVGWALAKREWGYAGYMGAMMAALLTSTWYFSIPRMLLSLFPAVLFLAEATRGRSEAHELTVIALASLASLGVVVFTQGAWFY